MRNSSGGSLLWALLAFGLGVLMLILFQKVFLTAISSMLKTNQSAGVPQFSSTQVSGFAFPTHQPPGHVGQELTVGSVAITVKGMMRPAIVGITNNFKSLQGDEEYLLVDISVYCLSHEENCHLTEFDFGVRSDAGRDIPAEFSTGFSDSNGFFKGGEIPARQSMDGFLIFIIRKNDSGLVLYYPRMFAFGGSAEFLLGP